jgi:hypothetical protein
MLSRSCSFNIEEYFIMRVKEKCLWWVSIVYYIKIYQIDFIKIQRYSFLNS